MKTQAHIGIMLSLIFTIMNISALTAPQRYNLQKTSPALLTASHKGIEALLPKEDIRTFRLLNRLPKEIKSGELFKRHFTTQELLRLYNDLSAIKQNLDETTGSNIYDVSDLLDDQGNFKGNNILHAIQDAAGRKLASKINCTFDSMEDGSCQPLITSTDPRIYNTQKARRPFKEINKPWASNWIYLVDEYEKYEYTLPKDALLLLPINFLKYIDSNRFNTKIWNAFENALQAVAQKKKFVIAESTMERGPHSVQLAYNYYDIPNEQRQRKPYITFKNNLFSNDYQATLSFSRSDNFVMYHIVFKDFPILSITGGDLEIPDPVDEEIAFTLIIAFAKNMGASSLVIGQPMTNLTFGSPELYTKLGFKKNENDQFVLDLTAVPEQAGGPMKESSCTIL